MYYNVLLHVLLYVIIHVIIHVLLHVISLMLHSYLKPPEIPVTRILK